MGWCPESSWARHVTEARRRATQVTNCMRAQLPTAGPHVRACAQMHTLHACWSARTQVRRHAGINRIYSVANRRLYLSKFWAHAGVHARILDMQSCVWLAPCLPRKAWLGGGRDLRDPTTAPASLAPRSLPRHACRRSRAPAETCTALPEPRADLVTASHGCAYFAGLAAGRRGAPLHTDRGRKKPRAGCIRRAKVAIYIYLIFETPHGLAGTLLHPKKSMLLPPLLCCGCVGDGLICVATENA
eukprot:330937-Chlamydomonas_euryale.AAC.5